MATTTLFRKQIPVSINSMGFAEPTTTTTTALPQRQYEYDLQQQYYESPQQQYVRIPQPVYQQQPQQQQRFQQQRPIIQQQQQQLAPVQQQVIVSKKRKVGGMTPETKLLKKQLFTKEDNKRLKQKTQYTKKGELVKTSVQQILEEKGYVKKPKQLAKSLVMVLSFNKFIHQLLLLENENSKEEKKIKWKNSMTIGNMLRKKYLAGQLEDTVSNRRVAYAYNLIANKTEQNGKHLTNPEAREIAIQTLQTRV